ncbi:histidine kinase [Flavobacterium sp.]|uniref:sensor histidine kinase n=1 Tax=Flavobacterium sp. TaxID=239 RepID=UPI001219B061|nr:histidine kinase [Flavobacterium sp.]RZJ71715.1 MAG: hypothetical protein EOO49_08605 [Flavobacterium sp.]
MERQDINIIFWLGTCAMLAFILALVVVILSYQRHFFKVQKREAALLLETAFASELKERQRIARDLHDGLQGDLSAVRMQLFRLKKNPGEHDIIMDVEEAILAAIENTRLISQNLVPPLLSSHGFLHTIGAYLEKISGESGVNFTIKATKDIKLDITTSYSLYRIIQEFSTNMIKHGLVQKCNINLSHEAGVFCLELNDDGPAYDFELAYRESGGMGLKNIKSRLETLGAVMVQEKTQVGNRFIITLKITP